MVGVLYVLYRLANRSLISRLDYSGWLFHLIQVFWLLDIHELQLSTRLDYLEIEQDPNISHCSRIARSCAGLNPEILFGLSLVLLSSFSSRLGARIKDRTERTRHITQPLTLSRVLFPCPFQHQLKTWSTLSVSGRCALRYIGLASHSSYCRSRLFRLIIPLFFQRYGSQMNLIYSIWSHRLIYGIALDPNICFSSRVARSLAHPNPDAVLGI